MLPGLGEYASSSSSNEDSETEDEDNDISTGSVLFNRRAKGKK